MEERIHNIERILDRDMPGDEVDPAIAARERRAAEGGR